jgi:N-acetylglucosamine-6-phosphate deacetylase
MIFDPSKPPLTDSAGLLKSIPVEAGPEIWKRDTRVISSGLCDLQVNGFAGADYNDPTLMPEDFEKSLFAMLSTGVTTCLPTVITGSEDWQIQCFHALEAGRNASKLAQAMVPGYHLEGPFLNPEEGFCGCHPTKWMRSATWDHFERLQEAAGGRITLITVAPEIKGVLDLIPKWVEKGIAVAIGHCNPDRDTLLRAADAGATLSTHLGNGIAQMLPKTDNPILGQLAEDRFSASFIADGFHQQPHVLGVYLRAKQSIRTILVTDGTSGSVALPGRYSLGQVDIERQQEDIVYIPGTKMLAGSATTLSECVANVVDWYGAPFDEVIRWASEQPRRLIGLPESLFIGRPQSQVTWEMGLQKPIVEKVNLGNWKWENLRMC